MQPINRDEKRSLDVPAPIATYLASEMAKDAQMLALCFAKDAWVHDEERTYRGLDAIITWKEETDRKYQYVLEPLSAVQSADAVTLLSRLTGNFPGSPVELDFKFTLVNDKISSLEIE
jgi:hypothetical protein